MPFFLIVAPQERLEDWEKYLTAVQDVVDVWLKALSSNCFSRFSQDDF